MKKKLAALKITEIDKEVDHISFLFNFVFSNKKLPDEIKTQLSRLQTYVLMSAINDHGFLSRSNNPVHLFLDTVVKREVELIELGRSGQSGIRVLESGIDKLIKSPAITSKSYAVLLKHYQDNKAELRKDEASAESHLMKSEEEKRLKQLEIVRLQKKIKQQENLKKLRKEALNKQKRATELKLMAGQAAKIKRLVQSKIDEITIPLLALKKTFILFDKVWSPPATANSFGRWN